MRLTPEEIASRFLRYREASPRPSRKRSGPSLRNRASVHRAGIHPETGEHVTVQLLDDSPDHHLITKRGYWYLYYNIIDAAGRTRPVRRTLGTKDREAARRERDRFLAPLLTGPAPARPVAR